MSQSNYADILTPTRWYRKGAGPRYVQLRRHLTQKISDGSLPPDAPLPSERDIAVLADVSRVTVRNAIRQMVADGLIVQRQGSGSFVAPRSAPLEHSLSRLTSFTEDMERRGKTATSEVLDRALTLPAPEDIMALGLSMGLKVSRIRRLRSADGQPMAVEESIVPADVLPDPMLVDQSLYAVLDARNMRPARAVQRISAAIIGPENAEILGTAANAPALRIVRTGYLPSGRAIELTRGLYRGDFYDFVAELRYG